MATYNYTKSPVSIDRLKLEIEDSSISSGVFVYANFNSPDSLSIVFTGDLSAGDKTTLDTLVSNHSGEEVYEDSGMVYVSDGQGGGYFVTPSEAVATATLSGTISKFSDLEDTPDTYPGHTYYYAVSSVSGIEWKSDYLDAEIHVSPYYTGDGNGSVSNPFSNVYEAATFATVTYSGTGKNVAVILHPGEYELPYPLPLDVPEVKSFIGLGNKTVILKPGPGIVGQPFITATKPMEANNITIDATDTPAFATTEGSVGVLILDDSYEENTLRDVVIKGFYRGLASPVESNIWARQLEVYDATIGVCVASGCLFDADMLYIDGCRERHLSVVAGAEAYIGESEFSSYYIEGLVGSGTAVYATGSDTYVELFAGTNIWSCDKNIVVEDGAEVKVDSCVLEETNSTPGIQQLNNSFLTIVNSRASLGVDDILVETPDNVYINAFDSTGGSFTIGNASQDTQTLFTFNTGSSDRPELIYVPDHDTDYRSLAFRNPEQGENTEFFVESTDGNATVAAHPTGPNAWSSTATLGLISIQDNTARGWWLTKGEGAVPTLTFKNDNDDTAMTMNYSAEVMLNTGVYVNKILDENNFTSNDPKALVTQQSTKTFVENWSYSSTALDSGQLDNRYYTETEVDTISGSLDDKMLYADGSKELSGDWDAGDYTITAAGFDKDKIKLDLAGYTNITGILTGGELSINAGDNTKLDVSAGKGIFVDMIDRDDPLVEIVSWDATTISPNLSGLRSKWIGVERISAGVGQILAQTNFTQYEKRFTVILGRCWGNGTDVITGRGNYKAGAFSFGKSMQDIAYAIGSINISGNYFYPTASGSMTLSRTAGESFRFSANYTNEELSPNISNSTAASGISSYSYHLQGQLYVNAETEIDPDYYDNEGTKTAVPSGKWTTQFVYYFPVSNTTHVVYGQHYHDTYVEAYDHVSEANYILNAAILEGSILRSYIFLKQGCTDLTDTSQAKLLEVSGFGTGGGGTVGGGVTDHGALGGLGDDDHHIYVKEDGTRPFTEKVNYTTHPTFSSDTELVDKKYVDDEISGLTTDHGELTGLSDDDHPQYHTDARGDARYYTQSQVDTISGSLSSLIAVQTALATVQLERDTDFTVGTTWSDVEFETTAYENQPDIIEHDNVNTERILIKADGTYSINYGAVVQANSTTTSTYSRIFKNGTTVVPASDSEIRTYQNERHELAGQVTRDLLAGDYITFQLQRSSDGTVTVITCDMNVIKLDGVKGEKGDPGEQGPQGVVTVSGSAYFDAYDSAGSLTLNTSWQDVPFNVVRKNSGEYTFNSDTELVIPTNTSYFITARVTTNITTGTNRSDCRIRIVKDTGSGYVEVPGTIASTYNRLASEGTTTAVSTLLDDFSAGDKIKVQVLQDSGSDTINLLANGSSLTVFIPAGVTGPQGPAGLDGTDGTDGIDAGGTLALVQARRTTTYSDVPLTWTDLSFDTTDVEYDDTHLEHDTTNRDRILINRDGYYYMAVNLSVDDEVTVRIRKNDTDVLPGSTRPVGNTSDANDMVSAFQNACVAQLSEGDFITVQVQSVSTAEDIFVDATFIVFALIGAKGDKGDPGTPGSGVEIIVRDENTAVPNTPHQILNFTGAGVTATDAGSGVTDITIPGSAGINISDEGSSITGTPHTTLNFIGSTITASNAGSGVANITLSSPVFGSGYFYAESDAESNTSSAYTYVTKVTLNPTSLLAGTYRIGWYYEWRRNTASNDFMATVVIDSSTTLMEHRQENQDVNSWNNVYGFYTGSLSSGNHTITLGYCGDSTGSTSYIRRARLEIWRVA